MADGAQKSRPAPDEEFVAGLRSVVSENGWSVCDALVEAIRLTVRQKGWSLNFLAKKIGRRVSTIDGLFKPDWNPQLDTLRDLETILNEETGNGGAQEKGESGRGPRSRTPATAAE